MSTTVPHAGIDARPLRIRDAHADDATAIAAIYAPYVREALASFEEIAPSAAEIETRREAVLARGLPFLVAERDARVVGYAYATPYRARTAYAQTIENSVYVAAGLTGQGIGQRLLGELIARCEQGPWRQMLAVIGDSANAGSIALHRRMGFAHIGTLRSVGFKLGRWVDTVLMQRALGAGDSTPPQGR